VEKDEAEYALRRYRDDGQLMVDNERRRLERELQFKKAHEDCVAQYESTIKSQVAARSVRGGGFVCWFRIREA
jgi:hypothetical protein